MNPQGSCRNKVSKGLNASYWPRRMNPTSPRDSLFVCEVLTRIPLWFSLCTSVPPVVQAFLADRYPPLKSMRPSRLGTRSDSCYALRRSRQRESRMQDTDNIRESAKERE